MDTATRAALVAYAIALHGGSLETGWETVDRAVSTAGEPTTEQDLRAVMHEIAAAEEHV